MTARWFGSVIGYCRHCGHRGAMRRPPGTDEGWRCPACGRTQPYVPLVQQGQSTADEPSQ